MLNKPTVNVPLEEFLAEGISPESEVAKPASELQALSEVSDRINKLDPVDFPTARRALGREGTINRSS